MQMLRGTVVDAAKIEHQRAVGRGEIVRGHAVERTGLVDDMKDRPAQREHRMLAALELQFVEAPQLSAFVVFFHAQQPKPGGGLRDRVVPFVGDADHQRLLALMAADDRMPGEHEAGARARETREDQPGHHREEAHAGEDFDRRDDVAVIGLRMHVAVADGRQRLDREVEQAQRQRQPGADIGDRLIAEPEDEGKHGIEKYEDRRRAAEKHRPVDGHRAVIEIGPEAFRQTDGLDVAGADPHHVRPRLPSGFSLFPSLRQAE